MSARQLIVLAVAAIAAIGALLLIRGMGSSNNAEPTAQAAQPIAGEQVLVVSRDIPQGAALTPSDLEVRLFPQDSVAPQMVRLSQAPSAQAEYVGAVTRRPFVRGEPLIQGSVQQPEGRGFMAAQLDPGFRAVALEIDPNTAVGGYIQPNDHVDVIVTATVPGSNGGQDVIRSDTVLQDIRVLALDDIVQPQTSGDTPTRTTAAVAVLEMSQEDARVMAEADGRGDISLALRGVEMETVGARRPHSQTRASTGGAGAVRVHSFGTLVGGN